MWIDSHGGSALEIRFGGFGQSGVGRGMGLVGLNRTQTRACCVYPPACACPGCMLVYMAKKQRQPSKSTPNIASKPVPRTLNLIRQVQ